MANTKTATLSFRFEHCLKETLRTAAEQEHRSIANMVEVMILKYCGRVGINTENHESKASEKSPSKRIK